MVGGIDVKGSMSSVASSRSTTRTSLWVRIGRDSSSSMHTFGKGRKLGKLSPCSYSRMVCFGRTGNAMHVSHLDTLVRDKFVVGPRATSMNSVSPLASRGKPRLQYQGSNLSLTLNVLASEGMSTEKHSFVSDFHPPPPQITKSDEAFQEEGIEFVWGIEGIVLDELNDLFQKVGFPRRDLAKLGLALANTYSTIWVRASRKSRLAKEGQLLGFARATSDGALSATIWDVAVTPAWQRNGLGRALVERLTAHLVKDGISTIALYAEPNVVGMYEKLGFVRDPRGVKGLAFQSKSAMGKALIGR